MECKACISANLPEPTFLLGQRLLPFSIAHALWLQRLELSQINSIEQLLCAVFICCHRAEQIEAALDDRWLHSKIRLWRWRVRRHNFQQALKDFADYTDFKIPEIHTKTEGENGKTPFLQHLKVTLISKLGYSISEALNCPIEQAIWDYWTFWEIEGKAEIMGDADDAKAMRLEADSRSAEFDAIGKRYFSKP